MGKAGTPLSGTHPVQRYRCSKCGATTTNPLINLNNNHQKYVKLGMSELQYTQLKLRSLKAEQSIETYLLSLAFREH